MRMHILINIWIGKISFLRFVFFPNFQSFSHIQKIFGIGLYSLKILAEGYLFCINIGKISPFFGKNIS